MVCLVIWHPAHRFGRLQPLARTAACLICSAPMQLPHAGCIQVCCLPSDCLTSRGFATGPAASPLHHLLGFSAPSAWLLHAPHLLRGYLGSRASLSVFGRWKVVEYRGLRSFLKLLRVTALAAFAAFDLLLPPAGGQCDS